MIRARGATPLMVGAPPTVAVARLPPAVEAVWVPCPLLSSGDLNSVAVAMLEALYQ